MAAETHHGEVKGRHAVLQGKAALAWYLDAFFQTAVDLPAPDARRGARKQEWVAGRLPPGEVEQHPQLLTRTLTEPHHLAAGLLPASYSRQLHRRSPPWRNSHDPIPSAHLSRASRTSPSVPIVS